MPIKLKPTPHKSIKSPGIKKPAAKQAASKKPIAPLAAVLAVAEPQLSELQARLVEAAARCVKEHGITGVRARDVAHYANCSPGMIYHAYKDLDELLFSLNQRTCARLDRALVKVLVDDPRQCLDSLAIGYLRFAHTNKQLWRAMFEHRIGSGKAAPEDYRINVMRTFGRIPSTLSALIPDHDPVEIDTLSRVMFSCVHGIVVMGLDETFVAVPLDDLEAQICRFIALFMSGLKFNCSTSK